MGLLSSLFGGNKTTENQQDKQEKKNFEILKYDGMRARNIRQLPYAIKCFEQALEIKEEPEVMQLLASSYTESGELDKARLQLQRLSALTPDNIEVLLMLASICNSLHDFNAMQDACQQAIKKNEAYAPAYYLAGKAAHALHNELQAIVMLTKATVKKEDYWEAYLIRAEVLWNMRQAKDALEDIEKVLSISDNEEDALLLKAKIMIATGQLKEAYSCLDLVMEVNPFNEKAYLLKGEVLLEQKQTDQAEALLTEAVELMPQQAALYQARGKVYLAKGEKEKSLEDMKKAIELNPENEKLISGHYDNQELTQYNSGIY